MAAVPPWQARVARALLANAERWPHALLIAGRRGIGKRALARFLAQVRLCEALHDDGTPCGACPSCRYVESGQHPDLRVIDLVQVDEEGAASTLDVIAIDRIRELGEFAQLSSHRERGKVAVIDPAEAMNPQAANALLKTLEEPPGRLDLILVSHAPGRLPPTIVSRCCRMSTAEPDAAEAIAWLSAHGASDAPELLAQAGGAPLFALELADADVQRERAAIIDALSKPERLSPIALGSRIEAAPKDARKARLAELVYWILTWTADLAVVSGGAAPRYHPAERAALASLARRVAPLTLLRYHESVTRQRALVTHPLQPRLFAEALLIEYRNLFARETRLSEHGSL